MSLVYHGETSCSSRKKNGAMCTNKAYYSSSGKLCCGVHSKAATRDELPKNPNKARLRNEELSAHSNMTVTRARENKEAGRKGIVTCRKMFMMKPPYLTLGCVNIFPNYKHANRTDGIGMPSLSPKSIGPVVHGQPGLPDALNLENFHQGNKLYPSQTDREGKPGMGFWTTQREMYLDAEPHRHHPAAKGDLPSCSIWVTKNEKVVKISYVESRQFYCHFYERAVKNHPDYARLVDMINEGYNLVICGYDAYPVEESVEALYLDTSRPFGHELVLFTMLTHCEDDYPWRHHKTFDF